MTQWWVTFTDGREDEAPGTFRGICIVDAPTQADAMKECFRLRITPGGRPKFGAIADWSTVPSRWRNRCLSAREAERLSALMNEQIDQGNVFEAMVRCGLGGAGIHPAGDCDECADPNFGFDRHIHTVPS